MSLLYKDTDYLIDPRELVKVLARIVWLPADIMQMIFVNLLKTRNIEMTGRKQRYENRLYQMSRVSISIPGVLPTDYYYYQRRYGPGF